MNLCPGASRPFFNPKDIIPQPLAWHRVIVIVLRGKKGGKTRPSGALRRTRETVSKHSIQCALFAALPREVWLRGTRDSCFLCQWPPRDTACRAFSGAPIRRRARDLLESRIPVGSVLTATAAVSGSLETDSCRGQRCSQNWKI